MNMMVFILCKITNKSPIFEIFYVRFFYVFIFLGLTMFFMTIFRFFRQILANCLVKNVIKFAGYDYLCLFWETYMKTCYGKKEICNRI